MNGFAEEKFSGLATIQSYAREEQTARRFAAINDGAADAYYQATRTAKRMGPNVRFINELGLALIAILGSLLYMRGYTGLDQISAFVLYSRKFSGPINEIANITGEIYAALAEHPNIVGVKEAGGDLALVQKTRELCPEDFYIWSGNDDETAPIMLFGGKGVISVAANVMPGEMHRLTEACLKGDFVTAGRMQLELRKLCEALFWEVNPIPVKTAFAMMGYCQERFRSPMCEMEPENRERLAAVLQRYGLVS